MIGRFQKELEKRGLIPHNFFSSLKVKVGIKNQKGIFELTEAAKGPISKVQGLDLNPFPDYRGKVVIGALLWNEEIKQGIITEIDAAEALIPLETFKQNLFLFFVGLVYLRSW